MVLHLSDTLRTELANAGQDEQLLLKIVMHTEDLQDEKGNFFDRKHDGITYRPTERMDVPDPWMIKGRIAAKPGRWLRRIAEANPKVLGHYADTTIETAAQALLTYDVPLDCVRLVTGEDIRTWYFEENYSPTASKQIMRSCMRYENCQPYFNLFTENPDQIALIVVFAEDGLARARALVWTDTKGKRHVDRIYGDARDSAIIKRFCRTNGIDPTPMTTKKIKVQVPNFKHDAYPCLDSLFYWDSKRGIFTNDGYNNLPYMKVGWHNPPPGIAPGHRYRPDD